MELSANNIPDIKFYNMTDERLKEFEFMNYYFLQSIDEYNEGNEKEEDIKYFYLTINGEEKFLQIIGRVCLLYSFRNKRHEIYTHYFELGNDYDIIHAVYDDYELFDDNGQIAFKNYKTDLLEDFEFVEYDKIDPEGNTGNAIYSQYNAKLDKQLYLMYPLKCEEGDYIYPYRLRKPLKYMFIDHASKFKEKRKIVDVNNCKSYARYEFSALDTYNHYYLATVREYGLLRT